jgi:hypothetical protein
MTPGPRSHELRGAVYEELGRRGARATGLNRRAVAAALRELGADAPRPSDVYLGGAPGRDELRERLADEAGMGGYEPPRRYNNGELEELLGALRDD